MSQVNRLLDELRDGSWHSNFDLIRFVYNRRGPSSARLAARIYDLKKRGHQIKGKRDQENRKKYWYCMDDLTKFKPFKKKHRLVV